MMASLGPHAGFIIAAYAVFFAAVAGLVSWVIVDGAQQRRALAELEARGIRRRSAPQPQATPSAPAAKSESTA